MLGKAGGRRNTGCEFSVRLVLAVVMGADRAGVFRTGFPVFSLDLGRKTERRLANNSVGKNIIIDNYSRDGQSGRWEGAV